MLMQGLTRLLVWLAADKPSDVLYTQVCPYVSIVAQ